VAQRVGRLRRDRRDAARGDTGTGNVASRRSHVMAASNHIASISKAGSAPISSWGSSARIAEAANRIIVLMWVSLPQRENRRRGLARKYQKQGRIRGKSLPTDGATVEPYAGDAAATRCSRSQSNGSRRCS
jgi:hypothetical protein